MYAPNRSGKSHAKGLDPHAKGHPPCQIPALTENLTVAAPSPSMRFVFPSTSRPFVHDVDGWNHAASGGVNNVLVSYFGFGERFHADTGSIPEASIPSTCHL